MLRSNFFKDSCLESEFRHVQPQVLFVQQPKNDLLAVECRHRGNTKIEFLLFAVGLVLDHDAAVLRQALFRDVQLGHDLYAAGHGVAQLQGRVHHRLQDTINTEPHTHFVLVRFNVNIASAAFHRIGKDQVDQLDDRRFFRRLFQCGGIQLVLVRRQFKFLLFIDQVLHQVA